MVECHIAVSGDVTLSCQTQTQVASRQGFRLPQQPFCNQSREKAMFASVRGTEDRRSLSIMSMSRR